MPDHSLMPETKRLTIGFVLDDSLDRPDGVQQYVLTTGEWLRRQGHDVHYLVSTSSRRDLHNLHDMGSNVNVSFNGNRLGTPLPAARRHIRAVLAEKRFDVLHVQMPYSPLLAGRVIKAAASDTAVVGTFHIVPRSTFVALAARLLALWCRRTLRRFDRVMSVSPAAEAFAWQTFGIRSEVVPNPVDLSIFRAAAPFPKPLKTVTILFLGRLVPRKGCQTLLEAIKILAEDASVPPFQLTICGKGPLMEKLKQYVRENGLAQRVAFNGFVAEEEKPRYYASADITVFPSNGGESFGIVLVEAMASGKAAVLAGDNPGYRSVLEHSPGDILFDPNDPEALATRLRALIADPAMREHIAAWQYRHADQYDINRIGVRILKTYASALRERRDMR